MPTAATLPAPPLAVRALNRALGPFPGALPLRTDALLERARRSTGLDDLGAPSAIDALERLIDGLREDGDLTPMGRIAARSYVLGSLVERLRIVEELRRDPAARTPAIEPLVVTGFFRSGTTFLHHLLGSMPSVHAPSFGEVRSPVRSSRSGGRARAIAIARWTVRAHHYLSPGADAIHPMAADEPEECLHLFENAFWSPTEAFVSRSRRLTRWIADADAGPAYRLYAGQLGLLARTVPTRRWALKWPMHLWWLETLLETFPTARVAVLERDPARTVPSVCSLNACTQTSFCRRIDRAELGAFWLDYYAHGHARLAAFLESAPGALRERVRTIPYERFVADPVREVLRLADWAGWSLDARDRAALEARARPRPKRAARPHRYRPETFGLTADAIRERLNWTAPGA